MASPLKTVVFWILAASLLGVLLSFVYQVLSWWLTPGWLTMASVHSLLAVVALSSLPQIRSELRWGPTVWMLGPSLAVLGGAGLLALISSAHPSNAQATRIAVPWAWILWVPLVEEVLYRGLLSRWMQARAGVWLGTYASALTFALAHAPWGSSPLFAVPIGPFLLGFACAWVYARSGSLWSAVFLHMSCNATPLLFQAIDTRWLLWLQWLYTQNP